MEMVITLEGKYMNPNVILLFGEKVYCFVCSAEICGNTCVFLKSFFILLLLLRTIYFNSVFIEPLPIVLKSRAVFSPGVNRAQVLGTYTV